MMSRALGLFLPVFLALGCAPSTSPSLGDDEMASGSTGDPGQEGDASSESGEADTTGTAEPLDPACRLIEGVVMCVPFDESLGRIEGLMIIGETDYAQATTGLSEHGLLPLPVLGLDGQTHAITSLVVLDYEGNEWIGPYREFLLQTLIVDPEHPIPEPVDFLELMQGLYGADVAVPMATAIGHLTLGSEDSEALRAAIEVGRDYFGFPKFYGEVTMQHDVLGHTIEVSQPATQPFGPAALGAFELRIDLVDGNPIAVPSAATIVSRTVTTGAGYPCWLDMTLDTERLDPHLWTPADSFEATGGLGALLTDLDFTPRGWSHFEETMGRMAAEQFCEPAQ
jgi:hypothetical protein